MIKLDIENLSTPKWKVIETLPIRLEFSEKRLVYKIKCSANVFNEDLDAFEEKQYDIHDVFFKEKICHLSLAYSNDSQMYELMIYSPEAYERIFFNDRKKAYEVLKTIEDWLDQITV